VHEDAERRVEEADGNRYQGNGDVDSERSLRTRHGCTVRERQNEYGGYGDKDNNTEDNANFGDGRRYESPIGSLRLGAGNAKDAED